MIKYHKQSLHDKHVLKSAQVWQSWHILTLTSFCDVGDLVWQVLLFGDPGGSMRDAGWGRPTFRGVFPGPVQKSILDSCFTDIELKDRNDESVRSLIFRVAVVLNEAHHCLFKPIRRVCNSQHYASSTQQQCSVVTLLSSKLENCHFIWKFWLCVLPDIETAAVNHEVK